MPQSLKLGSVEGGQLAGHSVYVPAQSPLRSREIKVGWTKVV